MKYLHHPGTEESHVQPATQWQPAAPTALQLPHPAHKLAMSTALGKNGLTFAETHFHAQEMKASPEPLVDGRAFDIVRSFGYGRIAGSHRDDIPLPTPSEALVAWFCCLTEAEKFAVFVGSHGRHSMLSTHRGCSVLVFALLTLRLCHSYATGRC